jgi:hypothetical protein
MRSTSLFAVLVFAVIGCQDKKSDPAAGPSGPSPVVVIPTGAPPGGPAAVGAAVGQGDAPLAGLIKGKPFTPDKVTLQGRQLSFRVGKDFFADMEISFGLPDEKDKKLEGKEWTLGGDRFGHPTLHVAAREKKDGVPQTEFVWASDYTMTLKITKHDKKTVEGTIDLKVVKPANTHLTGKFKGEVKRSGSEPLDEDDVPYVTGKIVMKGDWKDESISAGFLGKGANGKDYSNMIGSSFRPGGGGTASNTSFDPQISSIINDEKEGLTFRHTKLAPGEYFFYVRRDKVMSAWKKVTVKAGDKQAVDLTIDLANVGSLVVTVPDEKSKDPFDWQSVQLIPMGVEIPGGTFTFAFDAGEVKKGEKTVTIKNIPPGKWKVARGKSEAEVEIVAGKESAVTLTAKDDKK